MSDDDAGAGCGCDRAVLRQWRWSMVRLMMVIVFCGGFFAGVLTVALQVPASMFPLVVLGCMGLGWVVTRRGR